MKKILRKVRVKNPLGLHARPATAIVKLLQTSKSHVTFTYKKETINARSIMSVLMLAATKNALITIIVEGEDAKETMSKLVEVFEMKFGE
ncbi:MAG TPA: HPr family phosphocarrier protein [Rhabdochlamydiaceae bacterium]|jgi:phosphocarrier protein